MKVYRCCSDLEIEAYKKGEKHHRRIFDGTNTFKYEKDKEYIHLFLFAESMYNYSKKLLFLEYNNFIECDIPIEVLKKYFGYGYYERVIPGYYIPLPEFSIPLEEFDLNYITNITKEKQTEILKPNEYEYYKNNIPEEYLVDYMTGCFKPGKNEKSILEIPVEKLLPFFKDDSKVLTI